jgi:hypothetical protein
MYLIYCGRSHSSGSTRYIQRSVLCGYDQAVLHSWTSYMCCCAVRFNDALSHNHYLCSLQSAYMRQELPSASKKCSVTARLSQLTSPPYPSSSQLISDHPGQNGQATGSPGTGKETLRWTLRCFPCHFSAKIRQLILGLLRAGVGLKGQMRIC